MTLLGFNVSHNLMADVQLNTLTGEQKVSTYNLAKSIERHSYTSKIKLIFEDGSTNNYNVDYLIGELKTIPHDAKDSNNSDKLTEHLEPSTRLKIKEMKGIKLFIFNESGERIIKFESAGLKKGKRKIGPFEVPSNKVLIVSPSITYY